MMQIRAGRGLEYPARIKDDVLYADYLAARHGTYAALPDAKEFFKGAHRAMVLGKYTYRTCKDEPYMQLEKILACISKDIF
jgi:hypothetical protein